MNISVLNQHVNVTLTGKLYVDEASALREQLLQYVEQGYHRFTIDFSAVDYIDSSGLGVLVAIQKRALSGGGGIAIKGLNGVVKELFDLTRLTKVFEIV